MTSLQEKKKLRESSTMSASSLISRPWFGPVAALVLIVLGIGVISPDFFSIRIVDGHLYGSLVDVVHRGASSGRAGLTFQWGRSLPFPGRSWRF